jgi:hypothetical protein
MKTTRLLAAMAAAVGLLTVSALVVAGVPADKAEIKIDQIEGKKGAVAFPHKKHAEEYKKADGKEIACSDCHHTSKADGSDVAACSSCHVKEGAAQKEHGGKKAPFVATTKDGKVDQKSIVFHKTCIDCHKSMKAAGKSIHSCKTCHK